MCSLVHLSGGGREPMIVSREAHTCPAAALSDAGWAPRGRIPQVEDREAPMQGREAAIGCLTSSWCQLALLWAYEGASADGQADQETLGKRILRYFAGERAYQYKGKKYAKSDLEKLIKQDGGNMADAQELDEWLSGHIHGAYAHCGSPAGKDVNAVIMERMSKTSRSMLEAAKKGMAACRQMTVYYAAFEQSCVGKVWSFSHLVFSFPPFLSHLFSPFLSTLCLTWRVLYFPVVTAS